MRDGIDVEFREVGMRDGLQNVECFFPTVAKIAWMKAEVASGMHAIEICSFVPPKLIPQFKDAAEVVEATVVQEKPQQAEKSQDPVILGEDDQPSIVITMPTLSSLGERWKAVTAIALVVILVGAATTVFLQRSSGFITSDLQFGDSMDFQVIDSEISIVGEEMLGLVRDSTGEILERVCGELSVEMSGTGTVSVTDGFESGAVETTDSLGRTGFLAVEKNIGMDLDVDFGGRSWRD